MRNRNFQKIRPFLAVVLIFAFANIPPALAASAEPRNAAPDSFRGIAWDARLPTISALKKTVMAGCPKIVEQTDFLATPPCSHMHIDTDDGDLFTQRENLAPIFGVPVSEQLLQWSGKKFYRGEVFIYDYSDADLVTLRKALTDQYGAPSFENPKLHLTKWKWPDRNVEITLSFDPVAKPSLGSDRPPHTSISLSFGRMD